MEIVHSKVINEKSYTKLWKASKNKMRLQMKREIKLLSVQPASFVMPLNEIHNWQT